jgi:hypothetical protein
MHNRDLEDKHLKIPCLFLILYDFCNEVENCIGDGILSDITENI